MSDATFDRLVRGGLRRYAKARRRQHLLNRIHARATRSPAQQALDWVLANYADPLAVRGVA